MVLYAYSQNVVKKRHIKLLHHDDNCVVYLWSIVFGEVRENMGRRQDFALSSGGIFVHVSIE